jgi:antitoxin YefM
MDDFQEVLPVSKVKRELLEILKRMETEKSTIALTRNGEAVGVMMPISRYEALLETIEILSDKAVMQSLQSSKKDYESGRVFSDKDIWEG